MYNIPQNNYQEKGANTEVVQKLIDFYLTHDGRDYSYVWKLGWTRGLKIRENWVRLYDGCCDVEVNRRDLKEFARVWRENGYFISTCVDDKFGYRCFAFTRMPYTAYDYRLIESIDKFIA